MCSDAIPAGRAPRAEPWLLRLCLAAAIWVPTAIARASQREGWATGRPSASPETTVTGAFAISASSALARARRMLASGRVWTRRHRSMVCVLRATAHEDERRMALWINEAVDVVGRHRHAATARASSTIHSVRDVTPGLLHQAGCCRRRRCSSDVSVGPWLASRSAWRHRRARPPLSGDTHAGQCASGGSCASELGEFVVLDDVGPVFEDPVAPKLLTCVGGSQSLRRCRSVRRQPSTTTARRRAVGLRVRWRGVRRVLRVDRGSPLRRAWASSVLESVRFAGATLWWRALDRGVGATARPAQGRPGVIRSRAHSRGMRCSSRQ